MVELLALQSNEWTGSFSRIQPKTEYEAYLLTQLVTTPSLRVRGLKGLRGRYDHFFNRLTNVIMSNANNTGKKSKAFKLVLKAFRSACKKGGYASFWDLLIDVLKHGLYHQDVRHMTRGTFPDWCMSCWTLEGLWGMHQIMVKNWFKF